MNWLERFGARLTLKHRQVLMMVFVSGAVLFAATVAFAVYDHHNAKTQLARELRSKAVFIAANSTAALVFGDRRAAQETLDMVGVDPALLMAVLYDRDKRVFAHYLRPGANGLDPAAFPGAAAERLSQAVTLLQPLALHGRTEGWLYLVYDTGGLAQRWLDHLRVGVAIWLLGVLLAWLMASLLQRLITDPIVQLAELVAQIGRTRDYRVRMPEGRDDEIGVLIRGFNAMLAAIEEREAQLKRHGESLESLVELRTQQLHHRANYDTLTRLPNRFLLMEKLHQAIERARRDGAGLALLLIDLDRFKIINDSLGHHVGDELLQAVAARLLGVVRAGDVVGRLGGDEFVLIVGGVVEAAQAEALARQVIEVMAEPFVLQHHRLHVSVSIGISLFPRDAEDAAGLLRRADVSMYRSKSEGKSAYTFYDRALDDSGKRLLLESRLRAALLDDEFYLMYQPQVSLHTQQVESVEALLRWSNADLGDVLPSEFVPVAVEIGMINELTHWVIDAACRQQRRWREQGMRPTKIAVNVSAADLLMADFVERVRACLERHGTDPALIELEITEDVLLEGAEQIVAKLRELKSLGLGIAIDDFGTGYSSLRYLRDFPVDVLKLDGSFVERIHESEKSRGIVDSAISLAHGLGLKIVAECVETEAQFEFLRERGCDYIQGLYFSAPLTGDALAIFLSRHRGLRVDGAESAAG